MSRSKLGLQGDKKAEIINLKATPERVAELLAISGIFPAYHMNKKHWLTLCLDGSCDDETVKWVTKISFELTRKKLKNKKQVQNELNLLFLSFA